MTAHKPKGRDEEDDFLKTRQINKHGFVFAVLALTSLFLLLVFLGPATRLPVKPQEVEVFHDTRTQDNDYEKSNLEQWESSFYQEIPVSFERDFIRGSKTATIEIIEFSDFQCPYCRKAQYSLSLMLDRYPDQVRWVFKNFPLDKDCNESMETQLHELACRTAVIARCIGASDPELFWLFHDAVFASKTLTQEVLDGISVDLVRDKKTFSECVTGQESYTLVREDVEVGRSIGLTATPTIYINGRMASSYDPELLSEIIEYIIETNGEV